VINCGGPSKEEMEETFVPTILKSVIRMNLVKKTEIVIKAQQQQQPNVNVENPGLKESDGFSEEVLDFLEEEDYI
jgi:hypothetical protein